MMQLLSLVGPAILASCVLSTKPDCLPEYESCEFWLHVDQGLVMQRNKKLLTPYRGKVYESTDVQFNYPITDGFIQADGYNAITRMVMTVNDSTPGPEIHVFAGQLITVHVTNGFDSESLTIHWHGIHQTGTPYMDGVPMVTQCPILPGQTFDYSFKASPEGTHWYHSHAGSQRTNGVYGAFIVHPKDATPPFTSEQVLLLSDWVHDYDSMTAYLKMTYGLFKDRSTYTPGLSVDGGQFSQLDFQSGLINGKGRVHSPSGSNNGAPLHQFNVDQGKIYRFRVIAAGSLYPFRVSIDSHQLLVIASDGYAFAPVNVESFIINPGERIDFSLNASNPKNNYWIRAQSIERGFEQKHIAEAVLHYNGIPNTTDYDSNIANQRRPCVAGNECIVLNCPYPVYPSTSYPNTRCLTFDKLNNNVDGGKNAPSDYHEEIFLNFAFPGDSEPAPSSINGRRFLSPTSVAYLYQTSGYQMCKDELCGRGKLCNCTYTKTLVKDKVYQMVFTNIGVGSGYAHPVHIHGHSFYVVEIGFGQYNDVSGQIKTDSTNISCFGDAYCNEAAWNFSAAHRTAPAAPVIKDTIIVPKNGYVVVRLVADNPGVWLMHCHIDMHHMSGMSMLFEYAKETLPKIPKGFPTCGRHQIDVIAGTSSMKFHREPYVLLALVSYAFIITELLLQ